MRYFLVRSRAVLLFALLLFSSLAFSLTPFFVNQVRASSAYDGTIRLTDMETESTGGPGLTCTLTDHSTDWTSVFTDSTRWDSPDEVGQTYSATTTAWASATAWSVSQLTFGSGGSLGNYSYNTGTKWLSIMFTTSATPQIKFNTVSGVDYAYGSSTDSTNIWSIYVALKSDCSLGVMRSINEPGNGSYTDLINDGFILSNGVVSGGTNDRQAVFAFNWDIVYPSGYDGVDIPDSTTPPDPDVYPKFGYNVGPDNALSALIFDREDLSFLCSNYGVHWTLHDSAYNLINEVYQPELNVYNYTFSGYDTYTLQAEYYAGVPCVPLSDNYIPSKVSVVVNGEISIGSTTLNDCSLSGSTYDCDPSDPYTDCSSFGTDVGGYFQCVIGNFGTFLRSTLVSLFVPPASQFAQVYNERSTAFSNQFGFLAAAPPLVFGIFQGMIDGATTPDPVLSPTGTYFGAPVQFDMSLAGGVIGEDNLEIILGIIRAVTVVAILFGLWRTYMGVISEGKE